MPKNKRKPNQKLISNHELVLEKIPNPEDPYWDWIKFAFTINGYDISGGSQACADLSKKVLKNPSQASLTELRCALFFQQRADKWGGEYSDGPEENAKTLIKLIKERVRKGELE